MIHSLFQICAHSGYKVDPDSPARVEEDGGDRMRQLQDYIRKRLPYVEDKASLIEQCLYTVSNMEAYIGHLNFNL